MIQHPLKIGSVILDNMTILAPMAGITNLPLRLCAKQGGCGLVSSEMVSANGLVHGSPKTFHLLAGAPEEKPLSVQIFGSDPSIMADAAQIVESRGADILDINFGCSVRKILKSGSGSALMKEPELAERILKSVRNAARIPLTIKIRSGWDPSGSQALTLSRIAEDCGVDAITVHPRTATQGFGGRADWGLIAEIKDSVSIPVIGNGDITDYHDAVRMKTMTGCDGIMIGRSAVENPWIFTQILEHFAGLTISHIDLYDRNVLMKQYTKSSIRFFGEKHGSRMLRSRLGWFVKGLPSSSRFRESIKHITSESEALELISAYIHFLLERSTDQREEPLIEFS